MYGVIALFDEKTEQIIKDIWTELSEKSISFYADEVVDRIPHITLASYHNLDKKSFFDQFDNFYENKPKINITLNSIGSFLNTGTLFFSPIVSRDLVDFHEDYHIYFKQFNDNPNSMYLPGKWVPHCTLANRLSPDKLVEAYHYCLNRNDILVGNLQRVAIIEMINKNNAPIIYSKYLNSIN
ncbi:2'-5' RNA ligase family protein [Gottfriedia acidiceleris]|uniref:2'-5' RNA ligase family protein n=1 Tax=Gottfriedia acidiceleris TaxID=371036 RepID=UPI000B45418B|nr:2'-5' RNA ligase family protein [Gottfriedia acidiceleris]